MFSFDEFRQVNNDKPNIAKRPQIESKRPVTAEFRAIPQNLRIPTQ